MLLPAETFSTCGGNICSLRSGACSLLLGGLARGFEVRVDLKLDRVARGVRGLDVQLGRWLEQRMVSSTFPSRAPAAARPWKQLRPSKEQADLSGDPFGGLAVRVAAASHCAPSPLTPRTPWCRANQLPRAPGASTTANERAESNVATRPWPKCRTHEKSGELLRARLVVSSSRWRHGHVFACNSLYLRPFMHPEIKFLVPAPYGASSYFGKMNPTRHSAFS